MLMYHVCCWFQVLGIITLEIVVDILNVSLDNIDSWKWYFDIGVWYLESID
jgi:hypothetical protein